MLSCMIPPDRLTLVMWDVSALGSPEAKAEETKTYEAVTMIELKAGKAYEITAVWTEGHLEERGFSGKASYAVLTE